MAKKAAASPAPAPEAPAAPQMNPAMAPNMGMPGMMPGMGMPGMQPAMMPNPMLQMAQMMQMMMAQMMQRDQAMQSLPSR